MPSLSKYADVRGERRKDRIVQSDFDRLTSSSGAALNQSCHNGSEQVRPSHEVDDGWTGPDGRGILEACGGHHSRHRLNREIHSSQRAIRSSTPVSTPGRDDEPGVRLEQSVDADKSVKGAGAKF